MKKIIVVLTLVFASLAAVGQVQADAEAPVSNKEIKSSAAVTLVDFERVMSAAACDSAAIKDPRFVADAKNAIRPLIHEEDARAMLTNKKHVVMAYAAILLLLVGFVVMLFLRQQRLSQEILRMQSELERAIKDD